LVALPVPRPSLPLAKTIQQRVFALLAINPDLSLAKRSALDE
jgi:hypothetical protein